MSQGTDFKEVIKAALQEVAQGSNEVHWSVLLRHMEQYIIDNYDGSNLNTF